MLSLREGPRRHKMKAPICEDGLKAHSERLMSSLSEEATGRSPRCGFRTLDPFHALSSWKKGLESLAGPLNTEMHLRRPMNSE